MAQVSVAEKVVSFLEKRKALNLLLVASYTYFILFLHDAFVQYSVVAMNLLSLSVYNRTVMVVSLILFLSLISWTFVSLKSNPEKRSVKIAFLLLSNLLLLLHALVMFEMNIEIIHALEYAVFIFLLFPFTRRIGASIALALPVMLLDELNQYLFLYPDYNRYFELSDIVLDIIGGGIFIIVLNTTGMKIRKSHRQFPAIESFVLLFFLLISFVGLFTCYFAKDMQHFCTHSVFIYNQLPAPDQFWQIHSFTKAQYHVPGAYTGTILIVLAAFFFMVYDYFAGLPPKSHRNTHGY